MSSGSYFTLYRKYKAKITDDERAAIEDLYKKDNEKSCMVSDKAAAAEVRLPVVLNPKINEEETAYDEQQKIWKDMRDYSIEGLRSNYLRVFRDDNSYLDELMTWHFNSSFNCLKSEWYMDNYNWDRSQRVVDIGTARLMLQACNYLLSGKWSDETENILDNHWISVFADGNDCCSYWKYLYRNDKRRMRELGHDADNDNNDIEWQLKQMKSALETFVNADDEYLYNDKLEYLLVYTAW